MHFYEYTINDILNFISSRLKYKPLDLVLYANNNLCFNCWAYNIIHDAYNNVATIKSITITKMSTNKKERKKSKNEKVDVNFKNMHIYYSLYPNG